MTSPYGWKIELSWPWSRLAALAASLACAASALASAPALPDPAVPYSLEPWKAWVLHGQEARLCPQVAGGHRLEFCAWPGELKLEARQDGLRFSQSWEVLQESAVPLPGSRDYWPREVTVDGEAHPVLARKGVPVVWLPPGKYALSGAIAWMERPQTLDVPESVALVSLTLDGKPVLPLERQRAALSLGNASPRTEVREGDSVDVQVYRKLADGLPARLTTRVFFKVSGKARELSVAGILPPRFAPVNIDSPWMARLDPDGRLLVQAMPGRATVEIEARLGEALREVDPGLPPERAQEVWSYEAAPGLRATAVLPGGDGGLAAVDPRQAGVPGDWLSLPAFALGEGARLRVEERSRGQSERENQRLTLQREMWLDFSGAGFFARDRVEGEMRQGWRFDVARPYTLERADSLAARDGAARGQEPQAALLVTQGADPNLTGVEWRQPQVTLNAGVRLRAGSSGRIPVTGWRQSFDSVDTVLHLPYGYRLIAAPGADRVSANTWVEQWTILDIFLAAFFTLLAWKLLGKMGGLAAAAYLALAMPEAFAPVHAFAAVLILALLRQAVPEGRLRGLLRLGERTALLCLVLAAVVFIPIQIRWALYPQLETSRGMAGIGRMAANMTMGPVGLGQVMEPQEIMARAPRPEAQPAPPAPRASRERARARPMEPPDTDAMAAAPAPTASAPRMASASRSQGRGSEREVETMDLGKAASAARPRYAQSTVTQTGGGEPAWHLGQTYRLHWSGPVLEAQEVRFLVSPPWLTRLLRVLMIGLLAALVWRLVRLAFPPGASPAAGLSPAPRYLSPESSGACLAVLLAAALAFSAPAAAEAGDAFPSAELLEELRARLLAAPKCAPACVDLPGARLEAEARTLRAVLTAHVQEASSLALPEPDEHATLRAVRVDGEDRPALRFQGRSYLALPRGIHHVQLEYALSGDTASLGFPLRPARIEFASERWQVEGINENRLLGETLNFSLAAAPPSGEKGAEENEKAATERAAQQFPPFVQVRRNFDFGLDWSVGTEVWRIAPAEGGFTLPVPLLPGEHVTTPEVKVQDGRALAVFAAKTEAAAWSARLDKTERVELVAPPLSERAETWRVSVSPSWHLEWSGVPVTLSRDGDQAVFEFHPLPGERLTLTLTQPLKTEGGSRAIDQARLGSFIGQHASDFTLEFTLRASQGGDHAIVLPPELEVLDVQRDGTRLNLQARENRLSLPVSPGTQSYAIVMRRQGDAGVSSTSPAIDLGLPAANIDLLMTLGERRWILAARGPAIGPAVLYWGELAAALVAALLLARSGWSSIGRRDGFLLVLGFSTFSWTTLLFIVLWLLLIDWRARPGAGADWPAGKFNAMQVGIVALTVAMLARLVSTVSSGLLSVPDMGIDGYGSRAGRLQWFADRSEALLPTVQVFSLPVWVYRVLMLAWTLWLAYILIHWLKRGLAAWLKDGYWKKIEWWKKSRQETLAENPEEPRESGD
ncbi:MAG: hypothetical protein LBS49_07755 [Candidatus Accumulibacter sp.]|nr:hypothetical protein [Accumulibacter sp.]